MSRFGAPSHLIRLKRTTVMVLPALFLSVTLIPAKETAPRSEALRELLRTRIELAGRSPQLSIGGERIYASTALPLFYERRGFRPAWITERGPIAEAQTLVDEIRKVDSQGLRPDDYHLERIEGAMEIMGEKRGDARRIDVAEEADRELLLTDAFLVLGSHLLLGRVNPETIDPEWVANRRGADLARVLREALESVGIEQALECLLPQFSGYGRLENALAYYRQFEEKGGWPFVPEGRRLVKGDRNGRVAALRARLVAGKDLEDGSGENDFFDAPLENALRRFQKRHGLEEDGVAGPNTLKALNIPVKDRIRKIRLNMER